MAQLIVCVVVRRRISWSYFRNLWDEDFPRVYEEEVTRDEHYREVRLTRNLTGPRAYTSMYVCMYVCMCLY